MKKRYLIMAGLMVFTVFASTRVAQAQQEMVVKIPFAFVADHVNLPAGDYTLKTAGPINSLLLVNRADPTMSAYIPSNAAQAAAVQSESKVVFNCYGDRYFLSQVWTAGTALGRQMVRSSREKEMAQLAKREGASQVVLVASLAK